MDLYAAIARALGAGYRADQILVAGNNERGVFLYNLFRMAYAKNRRGSK